MSRKIDVELTNDRGDGSWSWRAAGARQPKGVLPTSLLYDGAEVGDVVRAEADFDVDGITITLIQAPKGVREEADRIEIIGSERPFAPVISSLTGKARERAERGEDDRPRRGRPDRGRDDRGPSRSGRPGEGRGERGRGPRPDGDRRERAERPDRPARGRPAPPPPRPKPKKLRPARTHRDAFLASLAPEQQPVAEQLLRGGMPAVRAALEEQNTKAKAEGGLQVPADTILAIAEELVPGTRVADWLDRADAARTADDDLALRDLRSVVASAEDVVRDERTRELADELRAKLDQRTKEDQDAWLADVEQSLAGGRVVRALRLSSRPPEPGAGLAPELATRLTEGANGALTSDIAPDRWATVLDAVAYSPVRASVVPAGVPAEPTDDLLAAVRKHAGRTPAIATLFGVEPPPDRSKGRRASKGAGRNPSLNRSGGPRNAAVPVPGRAGAPLPPARRIPPPPGRQIGATLPGSAPVESPPSPAAPALPGEPGTEPQATGREPDALSAPATGDAAPPPSEPGVRPQAPATGGEPDAQRAPAPVTEVAPTESEPAPAPVPAPSTSDPTAPLPPPSAAGVVPSSDGDETGETEARSPAPAVPADGPPPEPALAAITDPAIADVAETLVTSEEQAEVVPAGPADSSLPEPPPTEAVLLDPGEEPTTTGPPPAEVPEAADVADVVSEAAEVPFEPPADLPGSPQGGEGSPDQS